MGQNKYTGLAGKLINSNTVYNRKLHRQYLPAMYVGDVVAKPIHSRSKIMTTYEHTATEIVRVLRHTIRMYKYVKDNKGHKIRTEYKSIVDTIYTQDVFDSLEEILGSTVESALKSENINVHSFLFDDGHKPLLAEANDVVYKNMTLIAQKAWGNMKNAMYNFYDSADTTSVGFYAKRFKVLYAAYKRYGAYVTAVFFNEFANKYDFDTDIYHTLVDAIFSCVYVKITDAITKFDGWIAEHYAHLHDLTFETTKRCEILDRNQSGSGNTNKTCFFE